MVGVAPKQSILAIVNGCLDDADRRSRHKLVVIHIGTGHDLAGADKEQPALCSICIKQVRTVVAAGADDLPLVVGRKNFEERVRNVAFYRQAPG